MNNIRDLMKLAVLAQKLRDLNGLEEGDFILEPQLGPNGNVVERLYATSDDFGRRAGAKSNKLMGLILDAASALIPAEHRCDAWKEVGIIGEMDKRSRAIVSHDMGEIRDMPLNDVVAAMEVVARNQEKYKGAASEQRER